MEERTLAPEVVAGHSARKRGLPGAGLRRIGFRVLSVVYLSIMLGGPGAAVAAAVAGIGWPDWAGLALIPVAYVVLLPLLASSLALLHRGAIVAGRFPTDVGHPRYFHRRLYGLCWTTVYYSGPIYSALLGLPWLKRLVFRLFGYAGARNAIFYPDTWIRDLPLLQLGDGAYLSNKATIGTNVILMSREILVQPIVVGARSLVGHMVIVGTGVRIEADVQIGLATCLGVGTAIEEGAQIGPCCAIEHRVRIGRDARIGARTYIGSRAVVGPGLRVPADSKIPAGAKVHIQADLDRLAIRRPLGEVEPSWERFVDGAASEA